MKIEGVESDNFYRLFRTELWVRTSSHLSKDLCSPCSGLRIATAIALNNPVIPIKEPDYSYISYIGTRIKVKNGGRSAAEGCKATLITDETEFRVGWMIPEQNRAVTINAHDVEYLDLCAISEDGTDRVFTTEHALSRSV